MNPRRRRFQRAHRRARKLVARTHPRTSGSFRDLAIRATYARFRDLAIRAAYARSVGL